MSLADKAPSASSAGTHRSICNVLPSFVASFFERSSSKKFSCYCQRVADDPLHISRSKAEGKPYNLLCKRCDSQDFALTRLQSSRGAIDVQSRTYCGRGLAGKWHSSPTRHEMRTQSQYLSIFKEVHFVWMWKGLDIHTLNFRKPCTL